ncbi:unnamed protein product [Rotaria sp. Silwood1]|nr:unnamed protein product [Rotaria sp. Silwood1]CAF4850273.1 unnamed protein product [Rotaria sp. Silwood1]
MGQTSLTAFDAGVWYTGPMTQVYQRASVSLGGNANEWMTITLDAPFNYDPTQSLVIEVNQCGAVGATGFSTGTTTVTGFRRNTSLTTSSCPFTWGQQSGTMPHMGINVAPPAPDPTTWYEITTTGITTQIYGVSAPDINNVWACAGGGKVLRTTNGGTWTSAAGNLPAADIYYAIWAFDANNALVTSSPSATNVYRTTNAGVNWTSVFTQAGGFIDGFYFKDANNGIMVGDAVGGRWSLWKTTNGGVNWDSTGMNVPSTEAGWTMSVYGIGNTVWYGGNTSKIYKTTNFGVNWATSPTGTEVNGYSVWFNDLNNGMNGGTTLQQTTNGGTTFATNTAPGTGTIQALCGVGTKWWIGRANIVYQSTNNGTNWTTAFTAAGTSQIWNMTIARTGSPYIYAGRSNGTILKYGGLTTGVSEPVSTPTNYSLSQNYPNPFNPSTQIEFGLPKNGFVELKLYDILGKEVAVLANGMFDAGKHTLDVNLSYLSSGTYFYRLTSDNFTDTKKLMLMK